MCNTKSQIQISMAGMHSALFDLLTLDLCPRWDVLIPGIGDLSLFHGWSADFVSQRIFRRRILESAQRQALDILFD